jgi:hypothetical protein
MGDQNPLDWQRTGVDDGRMRNIARGQRVGAARCQRWLRFTACAAGLSWSLNGCRERTQVTKRAEPAAAPSSAPEVASALGAPSASNPEAAVARWNDALAKHDVEALRSVYADSIEFYGTPMPRDQVLKMKQEAFAQTPDFTQGIQNVRIVPLVSKRLRADFDKSWSGGGHETQVPSILELEQMDGQYRVVAEDDLASNSVRNRSANLAVHRCEESIVSLVASNPRAHALLSGPVNPDAGHRSNGLRIERGPPEEKVYTVAVHESHDTHLVTLGRYTVDPKTGRMIDAFDEKPAAGDARVAAQVVAACAPR